MDCLRSGYSRYPDLLFLCRPYSFFIYTAFFHPYVFQGKKSAVDQALIFLIFCLLDFYCIFLFLTRNDVVIYFNILVRVKLL